MSSKARHPLQHRAIMGLPLSVTAMLILLLLSLIILIPYWRSIITAAETTSHIQACQESIALFSTIRSYSLGAFSPVLTCPAPHAELAGIGDQLLKKIAEQAALCWEKTNGKNNRITQASQPILTKLGLEPGDSLCILCSTFTVPSRASGSDIIAYMRANSKKGSHLSYTAFLDTSWNEASGDPLPHLFLETSKPGIIPLPNGNMDGTSPLPAFEPETTYYTIAFSKQNQHTVLITSQSDASDISCDKFYQQRTSKPELTTPRYA